jgi:hypothetical protein
MDAKVSHKPCSCSSFKILYILLPNIFKIVVKEIRTNLWSRQRILFFFVFFAVYVLLLHSPLRKKISTTHL